MTPDTSRWKSTPDYTYIDDLVAPDLAWEWLRRNENYQHDYRQNQAAMAPPEAAESRVRRQWGLEYFVAPSLTAEQTTIFWSPDADTSTVLLTRIPDVLSSEGNLGATLSVDDGRDSATGTHFIHRAGEQAFHLVRLPGTGPDAPLAALIPLDTTGLDRIAATEHLLRTLLDRKATPDSRLTEQQRRRARNMLRAVDGHKRGASYREIAEVIYGTSRVRSEHWKTSALRDSVIGLVKGGLAMIAGGYRQLLRHRRRK